MEPRPNKFIDKKTVGGRGYLQEGIKTGTVCGFVRRGGDDSLRKGELARGEKKQRGKLH